MGLRFFASGNFYDGILQEVTGSGGAVFHLIVNQFYFGRLRQANGSWVFDGNRASSGMELCILISFLLVVEGAVG
jgi:hypothetical protein